jgi:hypothetical protein
LRTTTVLNSLIAFVAVALRSAWRPVGLGHIHSDQENQFLRTQLTYGTSLKTLKGSRMRPVYL